jgi:hypothetical protein
VVLEMYVDDVDKSFAQAVQLGGTPLLPPTDMFFGDRYCWVGDPWGHVWALATVKETFNEGEVQRRAEEFMSAMSKKNRRICPQAGRSNGAPSIPARITGNRRLTGVVKVCHPGVQCGHRYGGRCPSLAFFGCIKSSLRLACTGCLAASLH